MNMSAALRSVDRGSHLDADSKSFAARFDREPFPFRHRLAEHPLFALPRLFELVQSLARSPDEVYFDAGEIGVGQRWDEIPLPQMSIEDAFRRIESSGAWIIVRHAERDDAYARLLDECMAEAEHLADRPFRREMLKQHAIIFITSPGRVTPYHIDRECNFILQIHGNKTLHVFDRTDREVLTEQELERFWAVDNNAAVYKPDLQERAHVYPLGPGDAVHVPVNCPHWVKNGKDISVTLSVNFWYRDTPQGDVYRANYYLRRLGLIPSPPGDALRDRLKRGFLPAIDGVRRAQKALRGGSKSW